MTSRKSVTKNESVDVQKLRDEGNWKRLIELSEAGRLGVNDQLSTFLLGEAKLEQFLEEQQPSELGNGSIKAKAGLVEAKQLLGQLLSGKDAAKSTGSKDAQLLLAKLHFISGEPKEALQYLVEAGLDQITEKPLPIRSLKIVAESFAVQALSLEKTFYEKSIKPKQDVEQQMIKSMETAGDITLLYLQELDKLQGQSNWSIATSGSNSPLPPLNDQRIGVLLETALVRAPLMYLKSHKWQEAITRYRTILRAIESSATQTIRLNLARQLAELLLRKTCHGNYQAIIGSKNPEFHWKPKHYSGSTLFVPRDANEEVFLLLLVSEAMAVRDAVLSQSPEFREQRKASMRNASAVYDLLTLCCALHDQPALICESLERALKFSFDDPHIWSQFAHSLIAAGKFQKAVRVLKEVSRLLPEDPLPCLIASKICLENLKNIDEGHELADKAVSIGKTNGMHLLPRAYLLRAIASFIKCRQNKIQPLKQSWMTKCLESLREASELDPNDHLVHFYLALTYSMCRQIPQAIAEVRTALRLRGEHLPSLHLLSLLLSTWVASNTSPFVSDEQDVDDSKGNHCLGALALIEATLEEYPQNFDLLYVKALLEERCHGGETALITAKHMLTLWKSYYEDSSSNFPGDAANNSSFANNYDTRSIAFSAVSAPNASNDVHERESSIYAQSVAAARAEQALSDVTSSLCSNVTRPGVQQALHVQLRIWLLIGELYVRLGKCDEAFACAQEAALLSPVSHHVMYLRGLIHEQKSEFAEAKTFFKNATSLSPFHLPSLQHLGIVLHHLGSNRLAEKTLREAVRLDPMSENSWFHLGKVLEAMGEYEKACDCMATALQVQNTSPVVPFSAVPICFD